MEGKPQRKETKMATFYNQATLTFDGRTLTSNRTEGEIVSRLTLTKTAVTTDYGPGDIIVYAITLVNNDNADKTDITLTDDLGSFAPQGGPEVTPLTYEGGVILYYRNGVLQPTPTITTENSLVITGINVPAGGNVIIIYEVEANEFAPRGANAVINNTVIATGAGICEELTDTAQIPTRNEPQLSIAKAVCPEIVSCDDQVTYTFIIQNTGNTPVVATDDLIVSDVYDPILTNISVTLNGTALAEGTGYTYNEETGEFTTIGGAIPVPAATFTRDPDTGVVNATPGVAVLTVTGTI